MYTQCTLERKIETGLVRMVTYIPSEFAKVGANLKVKNDEGEWQDNWYVCHAGETTNHVPDIHKAIRNHRKNTGDSLPK